MPHPSMTTPEAKKRLKSMTQGNPALTEADYDLLVEMARRAVPATLPQGTVTSDLAQEPVIRPGEYRFDLNFAASEAWRWKAAKVVDSIQKGAAGAELQSQQHYEHCLEMAREYQKGSAVTVRATRRDSVAQ